MVSFTVKLDQLRLEIYAHTTKNALQRIKIVAAEHSTSVLCDKDQVRMELKNTVSACSIWVVFNHRPTMLESMKNTMTVKVRVRDRHLPLLNSMARSVNFVWNFVNEFSRRSIKERGVFLSAYDMHPYTKGAGKELGLHSQTLQCIAGEYVTRRKQFKKVRLNWRKSGGVRRSLGWIPVNTAAAQWKNGQVFHNGHYFKVWDSYGLSQYKFRSGSFNEDARGRWYFNVVVDVEAEIPAGQDRIGIDLGLTDTATDYKCAHAGIFFKEVNEAYTTQICSNCGSLPESRPKGIAGLGIREWTCSGCGVTHDRDINAAQNIFAVGHGRLVVGIPVL